jgi:acetyl-CoA carboxylase biotin carboxyl carrier protein
MTQKNTDFEKIEKIIEIMKQNQLIEVEIKHGDDKILLKRFSPQQFPLTAVPMTAPAGPVASAAAGPAEPPPAVSETAAGRQENLVEIKSPIVGTFYTSPSPDSEPYVEIGSHVNPQTVVCIIEAMKVMNEIKAETSGAVVEILVTSGQAVEYGQVLFRVRPD